MPRQKIPLMTSHSNKNVLEESKIQETTQNKNLKVGIINQSWENVSIVANKVTYQMNAHNKERLLLWKMDKELIK